MGAFVATNPNTDFSPLENILSSFPIAKKNVHVSPYGETMKVTINKSIGAIIEHLRANGYSNPIDCKDDGVYMFSHENLMSVRMKSAQGLYYIDIAATEVAAENLPF